MKFDKPDFIKPWKFALEEHFAIPETVGGSERYGEKDTWGQMEKNLIDVQNQRIEMMDKTGIELSILALNAPGIQGILDTEASC